MDYSKISPGEIPEKVHAIIEIPAGSNVKFEVDKDSNAIFVDRVMYSAVQYPTHYGYVPNTLANDGDPADILVVCHHDVPAGAVFKCRLIGALIMEDESGLDEKLIAVPVTKVDPMYKNVEKLEDLPEIILQRIKEFNETYKNLEPNKWVKVKEFVGKEEATKLLQEAVDRYEG